MYSKFTEAGEIGTVPGTYVEFFRPDASQTACCGTGSFEYRLQWSKVETSSGEPTDHCRNCGSLRPDKRFRLTTAVVLPPGMREEVWEDGP